MATRPDLATNKVDDNESQPTASSKLIQPDIYPEVSNRLKTLAMMLGIAFIVVAIFIQKYSGFF
jgi:hypothetical protein